MKALVTGASRGIGRAIAAALLRAGYEVIGTSRRPEAVPAAERLPGLTWLPLDLRSEQSIRACAAGAGSVDVLVNNAGGSQIAPVEEIPLDRVRSLFEMNLYGTIRLTQEILPGMRARRAGTVIAIASFAAVTTVPFIASYAASKAALVAFYRGMRHEVAPWGIRVAVVAPLDIHTTIPLDIAYDERSAYLDAVRRVQAARSTQHAHAPEPSTVARVVLRVLGRRNPRFFNVAGHNAGLQAFLVRHLPERVSERFVRRRFHL
jgi:short-subunit dehydrogenase